MNWIERMYELKGRDPYSQNGEGFYLEYLWQTIAQNQRPLMIDVGSGDGFILSNSRHLKLFGFKILYYEKETGTPISIENCLDSIDHPMIISMDIDGNDYWILDKQLPHYKPSIVIAEFNPSYTDSRTIKYNPDHVWAGDIYYGFTFEAGCKLAEKHGYKVIFQIADMNMIMVREDLVKGLYIPPITFKKSDYFKMSDRTDWVMI